MRRRDLLGVLGGAAAWPLAARAQQPALPVIGVLMSTAANDAESKVRSEAFLQGLNTLGWTDGRNLRIEYRWGAGDSDRMRAYAAELVALKCDVILVNNALALLSLKQATSTIPIVFTSIYDPVGSGFVASLNRPGGNITGFTLGEFSLGGKMLEMLKELAPGLGRVGVILNPDQPPHVAMWRAIEAVGPSLRVRVTASNVKDPAEIEPAIEAVAGEPNGGLIVLPSPISLVHREQIVALAARHRLPAIYGFSVFVKSGGLVSYGVDSVDLYRRPAEYVDRILKGAKPADLPVQQPAKFELAVNLKTAKALGLDVPLILQQRADEVIE
jgi:putative ABC transport system substrate-binding protein